jgi:2-polyprenyl-3-methyl-5-hydroxy-6-metoxy-1,4-benzoquinol methylase
VRPAGGSRAADASSAGGGRIVRPLPEPTACPDGVAGSTVRTRPYSSRTRIFFGDTLLAQRHPQALMGDVLMGFPSSCVQLLACETGQADTQRMAGCCDRGGYDRVFGDRFAKRVARRYRRRGLNRTARRMVGYLIDQGIAGATVLEIGGGVGEIQVELLRRGAARVTNLEISTSYEDHAAELLQRANMEGRVDRRFLDIAQAPGEVEPADIVVLHRVVCCYPDYERLLAAAGSHACRLLVFSHPPRNIVARVSFWLENFVRRLRGETFRAFVHPPAAMVAVLNETGLRTRYQHRGFAWHIVGLAR